MTYTKKYSIRCPECGHKQDVDLYETINVKADPALREALLQQQVNRVTCAACEYVFTVDKNLVYVDSNHGFMVYWMSLGDLDAEDGVAQFSDMMREQTRLLPADFDMPEVHLVFSRTELMERIFLFEEGLDERVIEYMKYMVYARNAEKMDPRQKHLLYNGHTSTEETISLLVQDVETRRIEGMLEYARDTYTSIEEMFDQDDQTAHLLEFFPGPYISARHLLLREPDRVPPGGDLPGD